MDRAATILFRLWIGLFLLGLVTLQLGLAPSADEWWVAGTWYLERQWVHNPFLLPVLIGGALSVVGWFAVASMARRRFKQDLARGAVPTRRVDTISSEQLRARALTKLSPHLGKDADLVKLLDALFGTAVDLGASELRISAAQASAEIALQVAMEQVAICSMPFDLYERVLEQLRVMVGIDDAGAGTIELRSGEDIEPLMVRLELADDGNYLIRLLVIRRSEYARGLKQLGMPDALLARCDELLSQPTGLVIVGAREGQGGASTLYALAHHTAALAQRKQRERRIVAIEPHVRQELPFMVQFEVGAGSMSEILAKQASGYDVFVVRNLADPATAAQAIQLASERLVLVSIAQDGAAAALYRLAQLIMSSDSSAKLAEKLAQTFKLAIGQRLENRLCSCRKPLEMPDLEALGLAQLKDELYFGAVGCELCAFTGYDAKRCVLFTALSDSEHPGLASLLARTADEQLFIDLTRIEQPERQQTARRVAHAGKVSLQSVADILRGEPR
jgi:type II secretory ATPase GspE/PulE/Tfp pilus assembly ATPase PilB-like protein